MSCGQSLDDLSVAAIQTLREPDQRAQDAHGLAQAPRQGAIALVRLLGRGLPMVARDQGDHLDLDGVEAAKLAVANQIVRVLVMPFVADVCPYVVEQRAELQPLPFAGAELVRSLVASNSASESFATCAAWSG